MNLDMHIDFFAPFDWASNTMVDFGIFINELEEKTILTDVFVILFIVIILAPHVLRFLKENPMKKFIYFLSSKNNGVITLIITCTAIPIAIMMHKYGIAGLAPLGSVGTLFILAMTTR
jgi:hypothetical protein